MTRRLLLVRHGRSSYTHDERWLDLESVHRFERGYNEAGIREDDLPPPELVELARSSLIVSSDMPRAIASARRLVPDCQALISPLLREIAIEPPRWIVVPMPVEVWDTIHYWKWTYRLLRGADHDAVRRARAAAGWLAECAGTAESTCVVTHGGFRRVLHVQLLASGWKPAPGPRTFANWSAWGYWRDAEAPSMPVQRAV